jgi:hypothetical protein
MPDCHIFTAVMPDCHIFTAVMPDCHNFTAVMPDCRRQVWHPEQPLNADWIPRACCRRRWDDVVNCFTAAMTDSRRRWDDVVNCFTAAMTDSRRHWDDVVNCFTAVMADCCSGLRWDDAFLKNAITGMTSLFFSSLEITLLVLAR